jgi:hypothetical protein
MEVKISQDYSVLTITERISRIEKASATVYLMLYNWLLKKQEDVFKDIVHRVTYSQDSKEVFDRFEDVLNDEIFKRKFDMVGIRRALDCSYYAVKEYKYNKKLMLIEFKVELLGETLEHNLKQ